MSSFHLNDSDSGFNCKSWDTFNTSADALFTSLGLKGNSTSSFAGVIHMADTGSQQVFSHLPAEERDRWLQKNALGQFFLGKYIFNNWQKNRPFIWAVTLMDGGFGIKSQNPYFAGQGAYHGFIKSLKKENPEESLRIIDFAANESRENIALYLYDELQAMDPAVEVSYRDSKRFVSEPCIEHLTTQERGIELTANDIVLVSGGGRGITAGIVKKLAMTFQCSFLLLGRSPLTNPDIDPLVDGVDDRALKGVLFRELKARNPKTTPREVDTMTKKILATREVEGTLAAIRTSGSKAHYLALDVNNSARVKDELNKFQAQHGKITAFIHGAGVLHDKLVTDKSEDQFGWVLETKIKGYFNLWNVIRNNQLKFVSPFTSVAGKFGNKGQSDYAAANEILNHVCLSDSKNYPQTRFFAVNWGPWAGGMVSPALARMFESQGIGLIPLEKGAQMFVDEVRFGSQKTSEIIIGSDNLELGGRISERKFQRTVTIDINNEVFLKHHCLKDLPVLPVVYIFEMFSDIASKLFPQFQVSEIRDMKVLSGVSFDEDKKCFLCEIKEISDNSQEDCAVTLKMTIRTFKKGKDKPIISYTGLVDLAENRQVAPLFSIPEELDKKEYPLNLEEMYRNHLFHGPLLKAIQKVKGISQDGIVAVLKTSSPEEFISRPSSTKWHTDPLVLDGMAQMGLVWLGHHQGSIGIPVCFDSYVQFGDFSKERQVTCFARLCLLDEKKYEIVMECHFINESGKLIARGQGWKSIFHESFNAYTTAAKEA